MSDFKRPAGVPDDPEQCYRAGYQQGAMATLKAIQAFRGAHKEDALFESWIETDLQNWRHDRDAEPIPPKPAQYSEKK